MSSLRSMFPAISEPFANSEKRMNVPAARLVSEEATDLKENQQPIGTLVELAATAPVLQKRGAAAAAQKAPSAVTLDEVRKPMTCSLCSGLVASSLAVSCGHTFCGACLDSCLNRHPSCPTCQVQLRSIPVRCLALDAIIDIFSVLLPPTEAASFIARREEGKSAANKINKMLWWLQPPPLASAPSPSIVHGPIALAAYNSAVPPPPPPPPPPPGGNGFGSRGVGASGPTPPRPPRHPPSSVASRESLVIGLQEDGSRSSGEEVAHQFEPLQQQRGLDGLSVASASPLQQHHHHHLMQPPPPPGPHPSAAAAAQLNYGLAHTHQSVHSNQSVLQQMLHGRISDLLRTVPGDMQYDTAALHMGGSSAAYSAPAALYDGRRLSASGAAPPPPPPHPSHYAHGGGLRAEVSHHMQLQHPGLAVAGGPPAEPGAPSHTRSLHSSSSSGSQDFTALMQGIPVSSGAGLQLQQHGSLPDHLAEYAAAQQMHSAAQQQQQDLEHHMMQLSMSHQMQGHFAGGVQTQVQQHHQQLQQQQLMQLIAASVAQNPAAPSPVGMIPGPCPPPMPAAGYPASSAPQTTAPPPPPPPPPPPQQQSQLQQQSTHYPQLQPMLYGQLQPPHQFSQPPPQQLSPQQQHQLAHQQQMMQQQQMTQQLALQQEHLSQSQNSRGGAPSFHALMDLQNFVESGGMAHLLQPSYNGTTNPAAVSKSNVLLHPLLLQQQQQHMPRRSSSSLYSTQDLDMGVDLDLDLDSNVNLNLDGQRITDEQIGQLLQMAFMQQEGL